MPRPGSTRGRGRPDGPGVAPPRRQRGRRCAPQTRHRSPLAAEVQGFGAAAGRCSDERIRQALAQGGVDPRSASNPGTRRGPFESSVRRKHWRSVPGSVRDDLDAHPDGLLNPSGVHQNVVATVAECVNRSSPCPPTWWLPRPTARSDATRSATSPASSTGSSKPTRALTQQGTSAPRREGFHSGNVTVRALGVADAASFYQSWPGSKARPGSGASSRRTVSSWSP